MQKGGAEEPFLRPFGKTKLNKKKVRFQSYFEQETWRNPYNHSIWKKRCRMAPYTRKGKVPDGTIKIQRESGKHQSLQNKCQVPVQKYRLDLNGCSQELDHKWLSRPSSLTCPQDLLGKN